MTMPAPADIRTAFPQFVTLTDAVIAPAIAMATPFFEDPNRYGDFLANAQNYCVASFIVDNPPPAPGQPSANLGRGANDWTSEDRETLKVTRDAAIVRTQSVDPFMGNRYGQWFRYFQRMAGLGGVAAVASCAALDSLPDCTWSG